MTEDPLIRIGKTLIYIVINLTLQLAIVTNFIKSLSEGIGYHLNKTFGDL